MCVCACVCVHVCVCACVCVHVCVCASDTHTNTISNTATFIKFVALIW